MLDYSSFGLFLTQSFASMSSLADIMKEKCTVGPSSFRGTSHQILHTQGRSAAMTFTELDPL